MSDKTKEQIDKQLEIERGRLLASQQANELRRRKLQSEIGVDGFYSPEPTTTQSSMASGVSTRLGSASGGGAVEMGVDYGTDSNMPSYIPAQTDEYGQRGYSELGFEKEILGSEEYQNEYYNSVLNVNDMAKKMASVGVDVNDASTYMFDENKKLLVSEYNKKLAEHSQRLENLKQSYVSAKIADEKNRRLERQELQSQGYYTLDDQFDPTSIKGEFEGLKMKFKELKSSGERDKANAFLDDKRAEFEAVAQELEANGRMQEAQAYRNQIKNITDLAYDPKYAEAMRRKKFDYKKKDKDRKQRVDSIYRAIFAAQNQGRYEDLIDSSKVKDIYTDQNNNIVFKLKDGGDQVLEKGNFKGFFQKMVKAGLTSVKLEDVDWYDKEFGKWTPEEDIDYRIGNESKEYLDKVFSKYYVQEDNKSKPWINDGENSTESHITEEGSVNMANELSGIAKFVKIPVARSKKGGMVRSGDKEYLPISGLVYDDDKKVILALDGKGEKLSKSVFSINPKNMEEVSNFVKSAQAQLIQDSDDIPAYYYKDGKMYDMNKDEIKNPEKYFGDSPFKKRVYTEYGGREMDIVYVTKNGDEVDGTPEEIEELLKRGLITKK